MTMTELERTLSNRQFKAVLDTYGVMEDACTELPRGHELRGLMQAMVGLIDRPVAEHTCNLCLEHTWPLRERGQKEYWEPGAELSANPTCAPTIQHTWDDQLPRPILPRK